MVVNAVVSKRRLPTEYDDNLIFDLETVEDEFLFHNIISFDKSALTNDLGSIHKAIGNNNVVIVKSVITSDVAKEMIQNTHDIGMNTPTSFLTLNEDIPNFHSINNENPLAKVTMKVHGYYFFSWNKESSYIFDNIQHVLNAFFEMGGRSRDFIKNTTKDEYLFRLQIFQYPSGGGHSVVHSDPPGLVGITPILFLTEKGKNYDTGGVYLYNKLKEKVIVDDLVRSGDLVIFNPIMFHGVDQIDTPKKVEWDSVKGRWVVLFNILPSLRSSKE